MALLTRFECPVCHEAFRYEPSSQVRQRLRESELTSARPFAVWIECPHCPAHLQVDLSKGSARRLTADEVSDELVIGGVLWDRTFTERIKDKVEKLNREGDRLTRQGRVLAGKERFEQALKLRKHEPTSWYNLGVCLSQTGDLQGAALAFRHATDHDEKLVHAWNNLGMVLGQLDRWEEADRCFDRGIEADPNHPKCYLGKGNAFLMRKDIPRARQHYRLALEKDPDYAPAAEMLRRLDLLEQGRL